ncbi:MAG: hypothetical protein GX575_00105 [Candidatus Anammoximicrobium sp.]|nr:hypothetical protein [Candidatus Anammoximicrobium sp.]
MSSRPENDLASRQGRRQAWSLRRWACAELAAYLLLAIVATWPLARFAASALPLGTEPAATVPLLNVWTVWWNADRAAQLYRGYWDAPIFAPTPGTFAFSEPMPTTVVAAPLVWFGGRRVLAYNGFLLAALALNGWSAFHLLRRLRFRWLACALGGGLVEMLPLVHAELGVLQMVPLCGIVWTIHALYAFGRRPGWRPALGLAAAFAVTYFSCAYYGLFLSLVLLASGGWLLGRRLRRSRTWSLLLASAGVALLLVAPVVAAQLRIIRTHDLRRGKEWVMRLAADPKDYAVTPWPQRLEPECLGALRPQRYFRLGPGWLKIGLAVLGLAAGLWRPRYRVWAAFCATMLAVAFLLSLGPRLAVGGWSPYEVWMDWYPGLAQARNVYRFAVFVQLAVALLAALGLQAVLTCVRRRAGSGVRWATAAGVGLLAAAEVLPPPQSLFPVPPVEAQQRWIGWLQSHTPVDSLIACFPFPQGTGVRDYEDTAMWMYWGTYHRRRLVNGYSGFFPASFLETKAALRGFPDAAGLQRLQNLGVGYCVRRRAELPRDGALPQRFELLFRDDTAQVDVYRIQPAPRTGSQTPAGRLGVGNNGVQEDR